MTHSDPAVDSRIIKTQLIAESNQRKSLSLGVEDPKAKVSIQRENVIRLKSRARELRNQLISKSTIGGTLYRTFFIFMYVELAIRMILRAFLFRPTVVHCNDWFVLPIAVLIKKILRTKLVYDAHELESKTTTDPNIPGSFVERLERLLWPSVDFFTTVSPSIRDWYMDKFGEKPSEIILNSPMLEAGSKILDAASHANYLRDKFGISESTKIYLYIGMLISGRGIDLVLEAFEQTHTNSAVVFLGEGYLDNKILTTAKDNSRIYLHKKVPHDQVVRLAQDADYGLCMIENVSLSDYFCIPNKLLEYAFSGLPVVASKLPEIQRIVDEFGLGECFDNSVEELVRVLEKNADINVVAHKDKAKLWPLSWEAQSIKLEEVFETVLSPGGK